MRELPERFSDAMDALEGAANHLAKLKAITEWPGLSGGQRMVAVTIACLEHLNQRPATGIEVARVTGLSQDRAEKVFDQMPEGEHPPYRWSDLPGRGWCFLPSQRLEYGE